MSTSNVSMYFDESGDCDVFLSKLESYFVRENINTDAKKKATLITSISDGVYKLLRSLVAPETMDASSHTTLIRLLREHFAPATSTFMARHKFYSATRQSNETAKDWAVRLKSLAADCLFGTEVKMLTRDLFASGYGAGAIQDRLFEEDPTNEGLTLDRLVELACGREAANVERRQRMSVGGARNDADELQFLRRDQERNKRHFASKGAKPGHSNSRYRQKPCRSCGRRNHSSDQCKYADYSCNFCKQKGHLATVCPKKSRTSRNKFLDEVGDEQAEVDVRGDDLDLTDSFFYAKTVSQGDARAEIELADTFFCNFGAQELGSGNQVVCQSGNGPYVVKINLGKNGPTVGFEIDTGSFHNIISHNFFEQNFKGHKLESSSVVLADYVGKLIKPVGKISPSVHFKGKPYTIPFLVVENGGPPLLGRIGLKLLGMSFGPVNYSAVSDFSEVDAPPDVKEILEKHREIFAPELGTYNKGKVSLQVQPGSSPKFFKCRTLPLALKDKVEAEIDRLVAEGILIPVENSAWATPIVPILKPDGSVRVCGDFRITLNPVLVGTEYPLPRIDHIYAEVGNSAYFSKIDLREAFQQYLLDKDSRNLAVINTTKGLFAYTRLCYGIKSAPAEFQRLMERLLARLKGVKCLIDDIIVSGSSRAEHNERLEKVLQILQDSGLRVKLPKCRFCVPQIEYLGHVIDKSGLRPTDAHVKAIKEAPPPENASMLKSFLGMVTFYIKFIPRAGDLLKPFYNLLKKNVRWSWPPECNEAFQKVKNILARKPVLANYEPRLPIKLWVDASPIAVSAILTHVYEDKSERPLAFHSKVLSDAETRYSQIEREALAIVNGVTHFKDFLFARRFQIVTDSKPLMFIYNSKKGIPVYAANRVQRWAYLLSLYEFEISYTKSENNIADFLSRIKTGLVSSEAGSKPNYLHYIHESCPSRLDWKQIRCETARDPVLKRVISLVKSGLWPQKVDREDELYPFFMRRLELSLEFQCLLWGYRVIVPASMRENILEVLHGTHLGTTKMKGLARSYFWWPCLDQQIEEITSNCNVCIQSRSDPPKSKLQTWPWPSRPWTRIHIDFLGPINAKYFLVVYDAHSKWIECFPTNRTTSEVVIDKLLECFARFGAPRSLTSDGATCFTSTEFSGFLQRFGINHMVGAPFHPQTNGAGESAVKIVKSCLKKYFREGKGDSLERTLNNFLFLYRASIHATTQQSPAKLMLGWETRTIFSQMIPSREEVVRDHQNKQKDNWKGNRSTALTEGERILARNYSGGNKWEKGTVVQELGSQSYRVKTDNDVTWRRHIDQLIPLPKPRTSSQPNNDNERCAIPSAVDSELDQPELGQSPIRPARTRKPPQRFSP
ncbi:Hypothetical Protein NTJ_08473 [Nesidiocoris tenuis]|uniref:RNA-directed DNA polymerase n=1 Tax=Nesidiocoris tenuis TaxID=355587 RepID=A0ABN7ATY0_9HEMI|nr:Hypothetical Protein NTJ_08473 [Nesidiocoris tenuis]